MGEEVEVMKGYKCLSVHLDKRKDWRCNTDDADEKGQNRHYFLRKVRSFSLCSKMLHVFYKSVVENPVLSAVICWGSSIRASDLKLNKLIKKVGFDWELLGSLWSRLCKGGYFIKQKTLWTTQNILFTTQ